jgi:signal transduction histidine kinase
VPFYAGYGGEVSSRAPRPPLTQRLRPGDWVVLDFLVGVPCAALTLLVSLMRSGYGIRLGLPDIVAWLLLPLVVLCTVGFRRRAPTPAYAILLATPLLAGHGDPQVSTGLLLPAAYVLYTVVVTRSPRGGVAALGVVLSLIAGLGMLADRRLVPPPIAWSVAVPVAFAMIIAWMTGHSVRQRRAYATMIRDQAAAQAVAEERLRIARELHDVVAHSMSVIAVQAGFGQYVIDSDVAGARSALDAIQETSRDALDELRRMLGVLRQQDAAGGGEAPLAPACGLADLSRLAERTRGAGVSVSLRFDGAVPALPPGVDLSAYRVVQEALTNVVKHAGAGASCEVRVSCPDGVLGLEITDGGHGGAALGGDPGTGHALSANPGHGIVGMRERVTLCGGAFSAGPLPGGGFRVTARIPVGVPVLVEAA